MITYTNYAEFMKALKETHNVTSEDVQHEPKGQSYGSSYGVRLGNNEIKHKHTGEVLGYWEVTSAGQEPGRGFVTHGRGNVCATAAQKQKLADERCYALLVKGQYGGSYISTGTSNSSGPWDKDGAAFASQDKLHDLEYDDEFGYGTIRVIKVKKVEGRWVAA